MKKTKWVLVCAIGPWLIYLLSYPTCPVDPTDLDEDSPPAIYSLAVGCNSSNGDQAGKEICAEFNKTLIDLYNGNGLLNSGGLSWTVSLIVRPYKEGSLVGLAVIGSFERTEENGSDSARTFFSTQKGVAACMAEAAIEMMEYIAFGSEPDSRYRAVLRLPKGAAVPLLFFGTIPVSFERAFRRVENLPSLLDSASLRSKNIVKASRNFCLISGFRFRKLPSRINASTSG